MAKVDVVWREIRDPVTRKLLFKYDIATNTIHIVSRGSSVFISLDALQAGTFSAVVKHGRIQKEELPPM